MKDTYLSARLLEERLIRLVIFSSSHFDRNLGAKLIIDLDTVIPLTPTKVTSIQSTMLVDFRFDHDIELGHSYTIAIPSFGEVPLDVSEATTFPSFDEKYSYDGDDLGANYSKEKTSWAVWAPLASRVTLVVRLPGEETPHYKRMTRTEKGVYRLTLEGDYEKAAYRYWVVNNEKTKLVPDPYAKSSYANGKFSAVIDENAFKYVTHRVNLPILHSPNDAIIYESNVRDLTIDKHTDIVHKGKYLGLTEKGRKTEGGHPAGLDYLKYLGITHLQLQPLQDFATVDENEPKKSYNWGYDPYSYFAPEGSYSTDADDPYARVQELLDMVSTLHEEGIRVVLDVVYNHVYEYMTSIYESLVPNYFFRHNPWTGRLANTSGCGNDVASERPMVRKLIVDSVRHWVNFYHLDGLRFDLMGIVDVKTLLQIEEICKKRHKDFLLYGEGWNMGGDVNEPLGTMMNYRLLPNFAFFNDEYREVAKSFLGGNCDAKWHYKFVTMGSCSEYDGHQPKYLSCSQSINYVECHDNGVFFDLMGKFRDYLSTEDKLDYCKLALGGVVLSFGIPFIHAGQEIGQSKFGHENTYNMPDEYNRFSYKLLDERWEMAHFAHDIIALRKNMRFFHHSDPEIISEMVSFEDLGGGYRMHFPSESAITPFKEFDVFLNPSDEDLVYSYSKAHSIVLASSGIHYGTRLKAESVLIPKRSLLIASLK